MWNWHLAFATFNVSMFFSQQLWFINRYIFIFCCCFYVMFTKKEESFLVVASTFSVNFSARLRVSRAQEGWTRSPQKEKTHINTWFPVASMLAVHLLSANTQLHTQRRGLPGTSPVAAIVSVSLYSHPLLFVQIT